MQDQSTVSAGRAEVTHLDLQLYRVPEAMRILSLRRSTIYELIRSGRLRSVREGRARLIPASAIAEYVALLKNEAQQ
jgi:excisionase family DNA binding protein